MIEKLLCPKCGERPLTEYGAIKIVWIDGVRRAFRRHLKCETNVGLERRRILSASR